EAVELFGQDDLAAQPRGRLHADREVEHVLLFRAGLLEPVGERGIDDHMARRAGDRALARPLNAEIVHARDLHDREAARGLDLLASARRRDEGDPGHAGRRARGVRAQTVNDSPQPQRLASLGLLNLNAAPSLSSTKSISVPSRYIDALGSITTLTPSASTTSSPGAISRAKSIV